MDGTTNIESKLQEQLYTLQAGYAQSLSAARQNHHYQEELLLQFSAGSSLYAVEAKDLLAINCPENIIKVPSSKNFVCGAFAYNQEVITLVSIENIFNASANSHSQAKYALIIRPLKRQVALLVNEIHGLVSVNQQLLKTYKEDGNEKKKLIQQDLIIREKATALLNIEALWQSLLN